MALTLVSSPAAVCLTGNDIAYKINTDNQYSSEGDKARIGLSWSTGDADGEKFNLSWGDKVIEFTAAITPDDSGTQYPAYVSGSVDVWLQSLEPYFRANYLLSNDFYIDYDGSHLVIRIEAKEVGTEYTLTLDEDTSGVTEDSNDAGVDSISREFFQIICRIRLHVESGIFNTDTILGEDRLTPDDDGNVVFKIQEYLLPETEPGFTYPEINSTPVIEQENMILEFYVEYAETYDNEVKKLTSTLLELKRAIGGKINSSHARHLAGLSLTFFDELTETRKFLSNHPLERSIGLTEPVKLYYLNLHENAVLAFIVKIIYSNGVSYYKTLKSAEINQYTVWEICLSYDILDLGAGLEVDRFQVWVQDSEETIISETRTFIIDREYYENERLFLFKNSLDAYETFRTTGIFEKENQFDHNLVEKYFQEGDLVWSREANMESFVEETYKANSGWITQEQLEWANEFIMSTDRYLIENFKLYEILVTSKKVFQKKDDEYLYYIEFEFKKSKKEAYGQSLLDPILDHDADEIEDETSKFIYA